MTPIATAKAFGVELALKLPEAVVVISDDLDQLAASYDFPGEHWIQSKTRTRVARGGTREWLATGRRCDSTVEVVPF